MAERRAYVCTHKECAAAPTRVFLMEGEPESAARCPNHGSRTMIRQTNVRYRKQKRKP